MDNSGWGAAYTITADRSTFSGTQSVYNHSPLTLRIGSSKLVGAIVDGGSTMSCVASYNEDLVPLDASCNVP
jgi:hypothetical protein